MRKLAPVVVSLFGLACATLSAQACSSDDPVGGDTPDATEQTDATTDADGVEDAGQTADSEPTPPPPERPGKPTDGGLDLDARGPDEYVLDVDSCAAFSACGGELTGKNYRYTGGCFDQAALQSALRQFAGCEVQVSNTRGLVKGTFSFQDDDRFERDLTVRVSGDVFLPADCNPVRLLGCAGITAQAAALFPGLQCYELEDESCDCLFATTNTEGMNGTYTTPEANTLRLPVGDGNLARLAPYCVAGDAMTHTEREEATNANNPGAFGAYITWKLTQQ